ncbi:MAG: hypothetical protein H6735_27280 [Alphaproteobacteria bacterium]|nr:hypothetical protein [Alphaproteobacteria bacterium]
MLLLALIGCPRSAPVESAFSWADTPRLPSPSSGTYASAVFRPEDPGVASLMGDRPWDASLAGAAAGVGLHLVDNQGGLTSPEVREAAWRAGWPYPIGRAEAWPVPIGAPPSPAVSAWLEKQPADAHIGLIRARGSGRDLWVGLASTVRADLGIQPRQLPVGGQLVLPTVPGARATIADPVGHLFAGELHTTWSLTTDLAGEWLVEVRDDAGVIAVFPVYVGIVPPELGLLVPSQPPADAAEAVRIADQRLAEIRDAYGLRVLEADPLLEAAARRVLSDPSVPVEQLAPATGLPPDHVWKMGCVGSTVESCLDAILWDVRSRTGLLAEHALVGRVAEVGPTTVHLVLVVGAE